MKIISLLILISTVSLANDLIGNWIVGRSKCEEPTGSMSKFYRHTCKSAVIPKTLEIVNGPTANSLILRFEKNGSFFQDDNEIEMKSTFQTLPIGNELYSLETQDRGVIFLRDYDYTFSPIGPIQAKLRIQIQMQSEKTAVMQFSDTIHSARPEDLGQLFLKHDFLVQLQKR